MKSSKWFPSFWNPQDVLETAPDPLDGTELSGSQDVSPGALVGRSLRRTRRMGDFHGHPRKTSWLMLPQNWPVLGKVCCPWWVRKCSMSLGYMGLPEQDSSPSSLTPFFCGHGLGKMEGWERSHCPLNQSGKLRNWALEKEESPYRACLDFSRLQIIVDYLCCGTAGTSRAFGKQLCLVRSSYKVLGGREERNVLRY